MAKKIKILQVVRPAAGGMKEHLLSLIKTLDRNQFDLQLACPEDSPLFQEMMDMGVKVYPVDIRGELNPKADWQAVRKLKEIINTNNIDLVHSHGSKAGLVARLAAIGTRAKSIFTVHGTIFHEHFSPAKKKLFAVVEKYLAGFTQQIITVSQALKEDLMNLEGIPESKIKVIYNGIPIDKFNIGGSKQENKKELGFNPDHKLIVTVARLAPQKGLTYLVEAVKLLHHVNLDFQLAVVGDGPLRQELEQQVQEFKLQEHVVFLGHRNDIPEILAAADIFVLPSLTEGQGLVILEAMAAGLPVIASEVGGIPEIISNGENGLLVKPRDANQLMEEINNLLQNEELRRKISLKGHEIILRDFELKVMVSKITDLYKETCKC